MEILKVNRNWFRTSETNWQLLIEINGKIYHKTVIIYDTTGDYKSLLETNKKIKEFDVIEKIKRDCGIAVELV